MKMWFLFSYLGGRGRNSNSSSQSKIKQTTTKLNLPLRACIVDLPFKACKIQKIHERVTRVITMHRTVHQSSVFPDLELLLSGFAIVFKISTELPENTNQTPNLTSFETKAWTTSTWPSTSQLTNGPLFSPFCKWTECFHTSHPRAVAVYDQVSKRGHSEGHWAKTTRDL